MHSRGVESHHGGVQAYPLMDERRTLRDRRGRPSLGEQAMTSIVSVSLPSLLHDRLIAMANKRGVPLSKMVRQMILAHLRS
jgi:macrodomain Ter protein organizer (MatP/YcbG family)